MAFLSSSNRPTVVLFYGQFVKLDYMLVPFGVDPYLYFGLVCLRPLSTIFQLYYNGQFYWWRKSEIETDCIRSCKSNYHTIMNTAAPSDIDLRSECEA